MGGFLRPIYGLSTKGLAFLPRWLTQRPESPESPLRPLRTGYSLQSPFLAAEQATLSSHDLFLLKGTTAFISLHSRYDYWGTLALSFAACPRQLTVKVRVLPGRVPVGLPGTSVSQPSLLEKIPVHLEVPPCNLLCPRHLLIISRKNVLFSGPVLKKAQSIRPVATVLLLG